MNRAVTKTLIAVERRFREYPAKIEPFDIRLQKLKSFLEDRIFERRYMTIHEATILDVIRKYETGEAPHNKERS